MDTVQHNIHNTKQQLSQTFKESNPTLIYVASIKYKCHINISF